MLYYVHRVAAFCPLPSIAKHVRKTRTHCWKIKRLCHVLNLQLFSLWSLIRIVDYPDDTMRRVLCTSKFVLAMRRILRSYSEFISFINTSSIISLHDVIPMTHDSDSQILCLGPRASFLSRKVGDTILATLNDNNAVL